MGVEICVAQAELADFRSQCSHERASVNMFTAEYDAPAAREVTAIRNWRAVQVAQGAFSRDGTNARCRAYRIEAALIKLHTEDYDFVAANNLCRSSILSLVDSRHGPFMSTLYEACGESMLCLRGENDHSVYSAMAVVHGQFLCFCGSAHAVHWRTKVSFGTESLETE